MSMVKNDDILVMETEKFRVKTRGVLGRDGVSRQKVLLEHPGAVAYGKVYPEFWIGKPLNGEKAHPGNGVHFGFVAQSSQQVDEFYRVALEAGGKDNGPPGPRPIYGEPYYGCFVFDLDGNKIEATFWDESKQ